MRVHQKADGGFSAGAEPPATLTIERVETGNFREETVLAISPGGYTNCRSRTTIRKVATPASFKDLLVNEGKAAGQPLARSKIARDR